MTKQQKVVKRTFITMSPWQFIASSLMVGVIAGGVSVLNSAYQDYRLLPVVVTSQTSKECVRVINLENGHAFNCQDVDVVLRRYNTRIQENENLSTSNMQQLPKVN